MVQGGEQTSYERMMKKGKDGKEGIGGTKKMKGLSLGKVEKWICLILLFVARNFRVANASSECIHSREENMEGCLVAEENCEKWLE